MAARRLLTRGPNPLEPPEAQPQTVPVGKRTALKVQEKVAPPEGRYKGNLPFLLRGRACEVRRRRTSALLPRSRLGGSDACGLGRR